MNKIILVLPIIAALILVASDQAFGDHYPEILSTTATNGTSLDSIPFTVVFNDPTHVLLHGHIGVSFDGNRQQPPTSASTPTAEPVYIGAFNERGIGILGSGDGQFYHPRAIAVNSTGHIYVADSNNNRVQIFDENGNYISQFGIGAPHAIAKNNTHMFITDTANHRIKIFDHSGNFVSQFGSGPGNSDGMFNSPKGIAVNSTGFIFVLDANNYRIQIFDKSGNYVDKFGQLGQDHPHQFVRPVAIAINGTTNNIFVADYVGDKIMIFSQAGKYLRDLKSASVDNTNIDGPSAIAINNEDHIYVADQNNGRVLKFVQDSGTTTYTGTVYDDDDGDDYDRFKNNPKVHPAPSAIAFDNSGTIHVADAQRHNVFVDRKVYSFNVITQGTGHIQVWLNDGNPIGHDSKWIYLTIDKTGPTAITISNPIDITNLKNIPFIVKANEPITNLEISDIVSSQGTVQNLRSPIEYYDTGFSVTNNFHKAQIAVNEAGYIYVPNPREDYVEIYDPYGNRVSTLNHPIVAGLKTGFDGPIGIAINSTGYIYVTDTAHDSVHIFDPQNQHVSYFGTHGGALSSDPGKFVRPSGIEINSTGHVFVVEQNNHRVQILGPSGNYLDHFGGDGSGTRGAGSGDGQFREPRDIAINSTGHIYVADADNKRIQIFDPSGNYVDQFNSAGVGNGEFDRLRTIAIDSDDNVYVGDIGKNKRVNVDPTCKRFCTTVNVFVTGSNGVHIFGPSGNYLGDLDIVGEDKIIQPAGIYFDSNGDTYVSDSRGNQIYIERDGFTFEVVNVQNGQLTVTIPLNAVTDLAGNRNTGTGTGQHTVTVAINPDPPTNLIASPGNGVVTLSWTAPANTYGTPLTDYIIERNRDGVWTNVNDGVSTDTFTTVTGLSNGVTYQFRVHAINTVGTSLLSNIASATPNPAPAAPAVPTGLSATAGNGIVTLSWTAPDSNRSPLTDYTIQYKLNTANTWTVFNDGTVNQTSTIITGLTNGAPYQFRVAATNGIGTGLFSSPFDFTIPSTIDTVAPSVVISALSPARTSLSSIPFSIAFSENVTGFEASDISVSSGTVTNLVGSFTGFFGELGSKDGQFNTPRAIAVNSTGHIFVLENHNSRIQILEIIDGEIRHAANFDIAPFNDPQRMAINSTGHIFVTDKGSDGVHVIDPAGKYLTHLGTGQGDENDEFENPLGITINGTDHVFVVDAFNERVKILDSSGKYLDQIDDNSTGDNRLLAPSDIAINSAGHIFVTDTSFDRVQIFNNVGHLVGTFGTPGPGNGQFNDPSGIAINSEDQIYVADRNNNRVQIFDSAGNYQSKFNGTGSGDDILRYPTDIALDSMGGIYVTSLTNNQIYVERDTHSFAVQNPGNGRLTVSIPANSVHDAAGNGNPASNTVSVTVTGSSVVIPTVTAPGVPTGLSATAGDAQVVLSWRAPNNDGNSPITRYTIEQSTNGGTSWTASTPSTSTTTTVTVTGLTNDQVYHFRVSATNAQGTGTPSGTAQATPVQQQTPIVQPPPTVQDNTQPTITINGANPITISLGDTYNDAGATCTDNVDSSPTLTDTSTVDTSSRGSYTVTYTCTDDANNSAQAVRTVNVVTVPSAITNLRASAGDAQVILRWTAPDNGGSTIIDYIIEYSANAGTSWSTVNDGTSASAASTVTGLTNGQNYQFRVSAVNGEGTGATSNVATATPRVTVQPVITAPGAPTNLSAAAGDTTVSLSWTAPADNGNSPIIDYVIEQSRDGGSTWGDSTPATSTGTTVTVTGLTNDILYQFRVSATNVHAPGPVSNVAGTTPTASAQQGTETVITAPGVPTGLSAAPGNGIVTLSWTAPADTGSSAIISYTIQQSTNGIAWVDSTPATATGLTQIVTGLTNGVQYQFRVNATNTELTGAASAIISATPNASLLTAPSAPIYPSFWITDDATEVRLFWDVPASDGGSAITNYKPQYKIATATSWIDGPTGLSIPAIITGLTPNQQYEFRVFAINSIGISEASTVSSIILEPRQATTVPIPAVEPSAPTNLQATVGNGQIPLSWTAPTNNGGAAITDYKVEYQTSGGSWQTFADGTSTTTSATVTGLTNGIQYSFRVLATNSVGDSQPSNVVTATPTASATVPDAPKYPSFWLTDDATEVRLFWDVPASDGGSAITSYKPQYRMATDPSWTDGPTGLSIPAIITGLTPNQQYEFRVFAENAIGTSEASTVSSIILEPRN